MNTAERKNITTTLADAVPQFSRHGCENLPMPLFSWRDCDDPPEDDDIGNSGEIVSLLALLLILLLILSQSLNIITNRKHLPPLSRSCPQLVSVCVQQLQYNCYRRYPQRSIDNINIAVASAVVDVLILKNRRGAGDQVPTGNGDQRG